MSNRRKVRRPDLSLTVLRLADSPEAAVAQAAAYRCPDCDSERAPVRRKGRVVRVQIRHDSTCPWLRRWGA